MKCSTYGCRQPVTSGIHCDTHATEGDRTSAPAAPVRRVIPDVPVQRGKAPLVCPHCQTAGQVTATRKRVKRGISGGKATGAVLTGGLSLLGTGLSRKVEVTAMRCTACGTNWTV